MSTLAIVPQTLKQLSDPQRWTPWGGIATPNCIVGPRRLLPGLVIQLAGRSGGSSNRHIRVGLRAARQKTEDQYDFLYGVYPVLYALRAGRRRCIKLWLQGERGPRTLHVKDLEARQEIQELSESLDIDVKSVTRVKLDRMSENRPHQGFILKCRKLMPSNLLDLPTPSAGSLWVAFEGVTDPMNLGAVLRSAAFFHASGIIAERGAARLTAVASKASAGAAEMLPYYSTPRLADFLKRSAESGWKVLGTALPEEAGEDEDRFLAAEQWLRGRDLEGGSAVLVLGAEGAGLCASTKKECGALLHIRGGDGAGGLDSLNVSVAAGIALHSVRSALGWAQLQPPGRMGNTAEPSEPARRSSADTEQG